MLSILRDDSKRGAGELGNWIFTRGRCRSSEPSALFSYLCRRLQGQRATAEQAGKVIVPGVERFEFPYTYGDNLRLSGQYVLIAAVVLGEPLLSKEEPSYIYSVR